MTNAKEQTKIESYNDFVEQLNNVTKNKTDIVLSYYKYCWRYNNKQHNFCKDNMIKLLAPYGLKPIKVTKHLNIIVRFKKVAEAIIYVKPLGIDLCIYKY